MNATRPSHGYLLAVGVSHATAPVALRERLVVDDTRWREMVAASQPGAAVLLATCNRTEAYAWATGPTARLARTLLRTLADATGCPLPLVTAHSRVYVGDSAIRHLVRVCAGLDSAVLGEDQIRGQVRTALVTAQQTAPLPRELNGLFHRALEGGARVRQSSLFGHHPSVAEAGVAAVARLPLFEHTGLRERHALVLGAGLTAKLALQALLRTGARVTLVNRSMERARHVAHVFATADLRVVPWDGLVAALADADLVVGATASRRPVLSTATVRTVLQGERAGRAMAILDLALPRDVDPEVGVLPGVSLLDLDSLRELCPVGTEEQQAAVEQARAAADLEAEHLARWLRERKATPAIVALREQAEQIRRGELRRASRRLRDLSVAEQEAVEALSLALVNQLLHGPTVVLRERAGSHGRADHRVLDVLRLDRGRRASHQPV